MSRAFLPATAVSSSWRWVAAGRRSRSCVETPPTLDDLLALSRSGRHAASDHLEAAALAGVPASAAGGPEADSRALRSSRTSSRAPRSPRSSIRSCSCSTAAALRCRPIETDARILVTNGASRRPRRSQRLSRPRLGSRGRHRRRGPRGDPLRSPTFRSSRPSFACVRPSRWPAAAPPSSRPARRRPTSSTPRSSTSLATSRGGTRCRRSSSESTPRCISSSSRLLRSTSWPSPRSRAERRSSSPRTTSSRTSSTSGCTTLAQQAVRA